MVVPWEYPEQSYLNNPAHLYCNITHHTFWKKSPLQQSGWLSTCDSGISSVFGTVSALLFSGLKRSWVSGSISCYVSWFMSTGHPQWSPQHASVWWWRSFQKYSTTPHSRYWPYKPCQRSCYCPWYFCTLAELLFFVAAVDRVPGADAWGRAV